MNQARTSILTPGSAGVAATQAAAGPGQPGRVALGKKDPGAAGFAQLLGHAVRAQNGTRQERDAKATANALPNQATAADNRVAQSDTRVLATGKSMLATSPLPARTVQPDAKAVATAHLAATAQDTSAASATSEISTRPAPRPVASEASKSSEGARDIADATPAGEKMAPQAATPAPTVHPAAPRKATDISEPSPQKLQAVAQHAERPASSDWTIVAETALDRATFQSAGRDQDKPGATGSRTPASTVVGTIASPARTTVAPTPSGDEPSTPSIEATPMLPAPDSSLVAAPALKTPTVATASPSPSTTAASTPPPAPRMAVATVTDRPPLRSATTAQRPGPQPWPATMPSPKVAAGDAPHEQTDPTAVSTATAPASPSPSLATQAAQPGQTSPTTAPTPPRIPRTTPSTLEQAARAKPGLGSVPSPRAENAPRTLPSPTAAIVRGEPAPLPGTEGRATRATGATPPSVPDISDSPHPHGAITPRASTPAPLPLDSKPTNAAKSAFTASSPRETRNDRPSLPAPVASSRTNVSMHAEAKDSPAMRTTGQSEPAPQSKAAPGARTETAPLLTNAAGAAAASAKLGIRQDAQIARKDAPRDLPYGHPTAKVDTVAPDGDIAGVEPPVDSADEALAPTPPSPSVAPLVIPSRWASPPDLHAAPAATGERQSPSAHQGPTLVDSLQDGKDGTRSRPEGRHGIPSKSTRGPKTSEPQQAPVALAEAAGPPTAPNQAPPAPPAFPQGAPGHRGPAPAAPSPSAATPALANAPTGTPVRRSAVKLAKPREDRVDEDSQDGSDKNKAESATPKDAGAALTKDAHVPPTVKDAPPPMPLKVEPSFRTDATRSAEMAPGAAPIPSATSHAGIPTPLAISPDATTAQPSTATFAMPSGASTVLPADYAVASPVSDSHAALLDRANDDPGLAVTVLPHAAHLSIASASGELALHVRVRDGNADVNVSGSMAPLFEAKAPEVRAVLAGEGLNLGSFATDQHGSHGQNHGQPEAGGATREHPMPASPRRTATPTVETSHLSDTGIHVTA